MHDVALFLTEFLNGTTNIGNCFGIFRGTRYGLRVAGSELRVTGYGVQVTGYGLRGTGCLISGIDSNLST